MHLAVSVLHYKFKLILSQNDELVEPRILDELTHVLQIIVIMAEYMSLLFHSS